MNSNQTEGKWKQFWETVYGLRRAGASSPRADQTAHFGAGTIAGHGHIRRCSRQIGKRRAGDGVIVNIYEPHLDRRKSRRKTADKGGNRNV